MWFSKRTAQKLAPGPGSFIARDSRLRLSLLKTNPKKESRESAIWTLLVSASAVKHNNQKYHMDCPNVRVWGKEAEIDRETRKS
jgi:hypothetical protein